ncbi:hypothetical protein FXO38_02650 [Capsicum annuum]|nr:hypothetical protein FXO38_02650 [Capsicum annuum]
MCGRKKLQLVAHQVRQMNKECSKVELKLNILREQLHEMQEDMVANMFNSTLIDQEKAILKDLEKWKQLHEVQEDMVANMFLTQHLLTRRKLFYKTWKNGRQ